MREFLIDPKRDPEQEYTIHLFEFCNLRCAFCWQNHEDTVGIDTVINKIIPVEKFIKHELMMSVVFNIMGGEVFAPAIYNKELNHAYKTLSKGIQKICERYDKKVRINWVTNLIMSDEGNELLRDLLSWSEHEGIEATITTSYDPRGRFSKTDLERFKQQVIYWGKEIKSFSMLITKPMIKYHLEQGDPYFKHLYDQGYEIYFDYYTPDQHAKYFMPSDTELLKFFKYIIDNYPNCSPVREWIFKKRNYASCRTSKLILQDNTLCQCGNLVQDPKDLVMYSSPIKKKDNSIIENKFLEKYNCASCEFLDRCTLGCFMNHDYKWREELDECVYKLTHRYIEDVRVQRNYIAT